MGKLTYEIVNFCPAIQLTGNFVSLCECALPNKHFLKYFQILVQTTPVMGHKIFAISGVESVGRNREYSVFSTLQMWPRIAIFCACTHYLKTNLSCKWYGLIRYTCLLKNYVLTWSRHIGKCGNRCTKLLIIFRLRSRQAILLHCANVCYLTKISSKNFQIVVQRTPIKSFKFHDFWRWIQPTE